EGRIAAVTGTDKVDGIELKNGDRIEVDGVFFIKQAVAADVLLSGLETENGVIAVDRQMRTNIDGCFAAGDCTGAPYQIAKAVGEGNVALHSALSYLAKTEN
ncbi:MAG: FAD-dependent oxidoreductase, partial [Clostridia bacterium]|nr:FAD-dependent oxidoreductase [Clostridia bacterium]